MLRLPTALRLLCLAWIQLSEHALSANAAQVNITVQDEDQSIHYSPASSWKEDSAADQNSQTVSFHNGTHVLPRADDDFLRIRSEALGPRDIFERSRRDSLGRRIDSDDKGFVDTPVTVEFNFTGSAIYIYCVLPQGGQGYNWSSPSAMNLSFVLDDQYVGQYMTNPVVGTKLSLTQNTSVLAHAGLSEAPHSIRISLGPNSVFLLDYLQYTQDDAEDSAQPSSSSESATPTGAANPSATTTSAAEETHNIVTFAAAIGASAGVLGCVAIGITASIWRRRILAARREKLEREAEERANGGRPPMRGPAPFVPRYFAESTTREPPSYIASQATSEALTRSAALPALALAPVRTRETIDSDLPPTFGEAISEGTPPILSSVPVPPPPGLGLESPSPEHHGEGEQSGESDTGSGMYFVHASEDGSEEPLRPPDSDSPTPSSISESDQSAAGTTDDNSDS